MAIKPPKEFCGEILEIWNETIQVLDSLHELRVTDTDLIAVYCYHIMMIRVIRRQCTDNPIITDEKTKNTYPNPLRKFLEEHVKEMRVIADILGLSVKSRKQMDRLDKKMKGKKSGKEYTELLNFAKAGKK